MTQPTHQKDRSVTMVSHDLTTATAWGETDGEFAGYGRVHWVAVLPEYQGQGIGTLLMGIICQQLLALGCRRAFLLTSALRPNAIKLYKNSASPSPRSATGNDNIALIRA